MEENDEQTIQDLNQSEIQSNMNYIDVKVGVKEEKIELEKGISHDRPNLEGEIGEPPPKKTKCGAERGEVSDATENFDDKIGYEAIKKDQKISGSLRSVKIEPNSENSFEIGHEAIKKDQENSELSGSVENEPNCENSVEIGYEAIRKEQENSGVLSSVKKEPNSENSVEIGYEAIRKEPENSELLSSVKKEQNSENSVEKKFPKKNPKQKKKVALLLSYCGAGYFGMQKNPGVNTIEDELIDALHKAGAIKTDVKDDFGKISFQRCARTDKGVSAAIQVVSLRMPPDTSFLPLINEQLPPSIRVFGLKRVTKGFDSKQQCSARTYQYLLPTFSFAPTELLTVPSYRIKPDEIDNVNETLKLFCGTHNFHNFTSGKSPNDASSKRYIMQFAAGEPFVKKGHEFITLSVKGQSFVLHQIRKMIGLCIAICRGYCGIDVIEKAWGKNKVDIPKAPGLGLILANVHYDRYNEKYGSDGLHEQLIWDEYEEKVSEFKNSFIWDTIIETEITVKSMMKWLYTLNNHTYTENRNVLDVEPAKPSAT